jgi:hypothetical protein
MMLRRGIVGKSKGSPPEPPIAYSKIAIGGRYLTGANPIRTQLHIYDIDDYTSLYGAKITSFDTSYVYALDSDDNYVYIGISTGTTGIEKITKMDKTTYGRI